MVLPILLAILMLAKDLISSFLEAKLRKVGLVMYIACSRSFESFEQSL